MIFYTEDTGDHSKSFKGIFSFGNENTEHPIIKHEKKVPGTFKIETTKSLWIDVFVFLRSKVCPYKCGNDCKISLKGIAKPFRKT